MNPTSFNDIFPRAVLEASGIGANAFNSPLFNFEIPVEIVRSGVDAALVNGNLPMLPFPAMRLNFGMMFSAHGSEIGSARFIIKQIDHGGFVAISAQAKNQKQFLCFKTEFGQWGMRWFDQSGRPNGDTINAIDHAGAWLFSGMISAFLNAVYSPSNYVASTRPDKPAKSVQWMAARTHYVILHRSHAANKRGTADGAMIKETEMQRRRQAHCRRAHLRVLRASRFKNHGQTIWVKPCWVGPMSWKQDGSIYRLEKIQARSTPYIFAQP